MFAITIRSWLAEDFDTQIDAVLAALGIEHRPDDPEAGMQVALELGLSDGEIVAIDEHGEILLRTERAQILHNIEVAAARGDRTITDLVDSGEIRRADLRDDFLPLNQQWRRVE
jgi:hypothetical protein